MYEALSNRRTETAQKHSAATQKSRGGKTPLQRSRASNPLFASASWGNDVPPRLRLSTGSPTSDEQPAPLQEKQHEPVEDEETASVQRTSLPPLQRDHQVPPGLRLSAPVHARQEKETPQEGIASTSRQENTTGLPDTLKAGVESLSGMSLDDVHVHYHSSKPTEVQALAYTQGTEIHVGSGQEQHLAHEAWHVVQQKQGRVKPTLQAKGVAINDDEGLEKEAIVMGQQAAVYEDATLVFGDLSDAAVGKELMRISSPVLQLARLNLRADKTISGVSDWPSRPASNVRGSQGQHLTAYVAFQDMILSHVRDRTVPEAAKTLIDLLDDFYRLPGLQGNSSEAKRLGKYIEAVKVELKKAAANNDKDTIGLAINDVLTIRNQVPDTAISGEGGGHGEAKSSGNLEALETVLRQGTLSKIQDEDIEAETALYNMWRLFDYNPPEPDSDDKLQQIAKRVYTHLISMDQAYPKTYAWLSSKKKWWLLPFLRDNRAGFKDLPLRRLSDNTISRIEKMVQ